MAKNYFDRYVWLIDTINRHGHISFKEISYLWAHSPVNKLGENYLPERTFHNHREAILDTFGIEIKCDRSLGYYIANSEDLEGDGIRQWLLESLSMNNLLNESSDMRDRILFEKIPSSQKWLSVIVNAMRDGKAIELTYQSFWRDEPQVYTSHPYCLKLFKQRWYMLAKTEGKKELRTYALDERMIKVVQLDKALRRPANFNAEEFFSNYFGIIAEKDLKPVTVELRVEAYQAKYMETLPLHPSQKKISADEDYTIFQYHLVPTFDFKQELLSRGASVEVLQPEWFREELKDEIAAMASCYCTPVANEDGVPYIREEDEWKYA